MTLSEQELEIIYDVDDAIVMMEYEQDDDDADRTRWYHDHDTIDHALHCMSTGARWYTLCVGTDSKNSTKKFMCIEYCLDGMYYHSHSCRIDKSLYAFIKANHDKDAFYSYDELVVKLNTVQRLKFIEDFLNASE